MSWPSGKKGSWKKLSRSRRMRLLTPRRNLRTIIISYLPPRRIFRFCTMSRRFFPRSYQRNRKNSKLLKDRSWTKRGNFCNSGLWRTNSNHSPNRTKNKLNQTSGASTSVTSCHRMCLSCRLKMKDWNQIWKTAITKTENWHRRTHCWLNKSVILRKKALRSKPKSKEVLKLSLKIRLMGRPLTRSEITSVIYRDSWTSSINSWPWRILKLTEPMGRLKACSLITKLWRRKCKTTGIRLVSSTSNCTLVNRRQSRKNILRTSMRSK